MGTLIIIGQLILSLSILIVLHEFGHFLPARAFKTRVEKFYLFFDPYFSLFKKKIGDTEWGIGWLPLGGYVKISGMIDESMDKEQMAGPPQPWEFRSKKPWQRLIIMLGGVTVNFVLGFLLFGLVLFTWGEDVLPTKNVKYGVYADAFAREMGFQTGDELVSIDNKPLVNFNAARLEIFKNESKTAQVVRDGKEISFDIPEDLTGALASYKGGFLIPRTPFVVDSIYQERAFKTQKGWRSWFEDLTVVPFPAYGSGIKKGDKIIGLNDAVINYFDQFATEIKNYKDEKITVSVLRQSDTIRFEMQLDTFASIGALPMDLTNFLDIEHRDYTFGEAMPTGVAKSVEFLSLQINAFGQMFSGKVKASESLGGFGSIAKMFSDTWDWQRFWRMTAVLSLILGFMNLLPIPALDGGHVMFLLYEIITGRKPSDKVLEYATIAGFVLIVGLVLFANGLDILRLFKGE
jgi:regulator of sigma E protease